MKFNLLNKVNVRTIAAWLAAYAIAVNSIKPQSSTNKNKNACAVRRGRKNHSNTSGTYQTLLNQQIAGGKEAVNKVGNREDLPDPVSCTR